MYDPTLGRFITRDPIGFVAGDANLYRYVHDGPTNATDQSGDGPKALSMTELAETGQAKVRQIENAVQAMASLKERARKEGDVVRMRCIADKLQQVHALFERSRDSLRALFEGAASRGDSEAATRAYAKIAVAAEKALLLHRDAEQCSGEPVTSTATIVVAPEPLPPEDPTSSFPLTVTGEGRTYTQCGEVRTFKLFWITIDVSTGTIKLFGIPFTLPSRPDVNSLPRSISPQFLGD